MSSFEKFPREIRDVIYELCLCVHGNLVPYPEPSKPDCEDDLKGPKPAVALLALNKQIRAEALPILFSKNIWRITGEKIGLDNSGPSDEMAADTLWQRHGSHIKHVVLKYTFSEADAEAIKLDIRIGRRHPSLFLSVEMDDIDLGVLVDLRKSWMVMKEALSFCSNLKSLSVDFFDLWYPAGYFYTDIVLKLLTGCMATVKAEVDMIIYGILNDDEQDAVEEWRGRGLNGKERDNAMARMKIPRWDANSLGN